ncbi:MAG: haloacid dehalogenase type II [Gaiella sp.]
MTIDYESYDVLTFDCYGTLIDWETGLLVGLRRALPELEAANGDELLEQFAALATREERGRYQSYRSVLAAALRGLAAERSLDLADDVVGHFAGGVGEWPAFPDSTEALRRLQECFELAVVTNCDADLFAASNRRLGVEFDWVVTAELARAYKPSTRPFEVAFETIGVPRERMLHVAQSLFHDHVPAKQLGLATVWIDRRHDRPGAGATPPARASPDAAFPSMSAFADAVAASR